MGNCNLHMIVLFRRGSQHAVCDSLSAWWSGVAGFLLNDILLFPRHFCHSGRSLCVVVVASLSTSSACGSIFHHDHIRCEPYESCSVSKFCPAYCIREVHAIGSFELPRT